MSFFLDDTPDATLSAHRDYAMLHQLGCRACPLAKIGVNIHPDMAPTGTERPLVYLLGEAPGKTEDEQCEQFIGESGRLLRARIPRKFRDAVRFNNVVRCFPGSVKVRTPSEITKIYRRNFSGPLTILTTKFGDKLPCTPHHPILTPDGWAYAYQLKKGDYLVNYGSRVERSVRGNPNKQDDPISLDQIFAARSLTAVSKRVINSGLDFHGDWAAGDVDVISTSSKLGGVSNSSVIEFLGNQSFNISDVNRTVLQSLCTRFADACLEQIQSQARSLAEAALSFSFGSSIYPRTHLFRCGSYFDSIAFEECNYCSSSNSHFFGELLTAFTGGVPLAEFIGGWRSPERFSGLDVSRFFVSSQDNAFSPELFGEPLGGGVELFSELSQTCSSLIHLDEVIDVDTQHYEGFLYNLETTDGWFVAHDHIVSNTRPPKNATPDRVSIECCRPSVIADIERTKPRVIVGLGNVPLEWVSRFTGITAWRGRRMPVRVGKHSCWYYPLIHPAAILHKQQTSRQAAEDDLLIFGMDLRRALADVDKLPAPDVHDHARARAGIETISGRGADDLDRLARALEWAAGLPVVGIDYETRGLRPYAANAVLLSAAVSDGERSVAFGVDHPGAGWSDEDKPRVRELWARFLRTARGVKVAHNLSFETEWTGAQFGADLVRAGRWECTQVQASVIDERSRGSSPGPLALDFLTQQYFGISVKDVFPVDVANLHDTPLEVVLRYNCPDARYAVLLWREQRAEIERLGLEQVYDLSLRRVPTVVLSQMRGVPVDQAVVESLLTKYDARIKKVEREIAALDAVKKYERLHGAYNPLSNQHAIKLFHEMLGRSECEVVDKRSKKSRLSVDESVLAQIDHPLARLSLELRKATKMRSTYVEPLRVGSPILYPDGLVHASFNTTFAGTGRISCDAPNLQNYPKRTEEGREIRRAFAALPGCVILAVDYGQIEARVIAMMTRDERFCKSLWERYDVHMEWARRVALAYPARVGGKKFLDDKKVMKDLRTDIKNQWTFPLFFGASLRTCSNYIKVPEDVLRPLYDEFWEQFSGVRDWQEQQMSFYREHGYVECATGRRRHGPMTMNMLINSPIQGGACEIVMDAMCRMSETGDPDLQPEINVHDDLTSMRVPEDRVDDVAEKMIGMMLDVPFEWTKIVPISIEVSVGKNWMQMQEIGTFSSDEWFKGGRG